MGSKRKRESNGSPAAQTPDATNKAGPSFSSGVGNTSTPSIKDRKGKGKEVEADSGIKEGPVVHFSSADGAHWWSKPIDLRQDLKKTLKKVTKEVGLPKKRAGELRLAHIRDGGREADIWDDFDYDAFKSRVLASPGAYFAIKVYTPIVSEPAVVPSPILPLPQAPATPTPPAQSTPASTPATTKKSKKRVKSKTGEVSTNQPATPSTSVANGPTPSMGTIPTKKPARQSKKAKPTTPSAAQSLASTPAAATKMPTVSDSPSPSTTPKPTATSVKKSKKRSSTLITPDVLPTPSSASPTEVKKKAKPRRSTKKESESPIPVPASGLPAPVSTTKIPRARKEKESPVLRPSVEATPSALKPSTSPSLGEPVFEATSTGGKASEEEKAKQAEMETNAKKGKSAKREKRNNKRKTSHDSTPSSTESRSASPTQSAPSTPSPHSSLAPKSHIALHFADRYKPARPSPLRSTTAGPPEHDGDTSLTSAQPVKNRKRRDRKRFRESVNVSDSTATTPGDGTSLQNTIDHALSQAQKQNVTTAPEQGAEISSPPRKKARQEASTPSKASKKSQGVGSSQTTMQAATRAVENNTTSVGPMDTAPTTSDLPQSVPVPPKSPKKIVPLSAEYDLHRKPNESHADSSSIVGGAVDQSAGEPQASHTSPSGERSEPDSSKDGDVEMEESSVVASEVLVPETEESVPPSRNIVVAPETLHAPVTDGDESQTLLTTTVESDDRTNVPVGPEGAPAAESLASMEPTQKILTPKKKAPRARKTAETPKTKANGAGSAEAVNPAGVNDTAETQAPAVSTQVVPSSATITETRVPASDSNLVTSGVASQPISEPEPDVSALASAAEPEASIAKHVKARAIKGRTSRAAANGPPCIICFQTPTHFQKDCPEVKAGLENLRYLLVARQDQQSSVRDGEDGSTFAESVALIEVWIRRYTEIANKVEGVAKESAFKPRSPLKVMGTKTGQSIDLNAPEKPIGITKPKRKQATTTPPAATAESDVIMASPEPVADIASVDAIAPDNTNAAETGDSSDKDQTTPSPPEAVPDAQVSSIPAIHLKAMLKMQKSRRPGSLSGLSVSDAFIETEPSDDSSSDSEEDGGADEDDDKDTRSDAGSEVSSSSSVVSSSSAVSSDSDNTTASATSRVPMPTNPSNAISYSLTRELSEREKKKARLSAAKMVPVAYDAQSITDDADGDIEDPSEPPSPVKQRSSYARAGSESSIGDFGDDMSRRSSMESITQAPYISQAPPIIASSSTQDLVPEPTRSESDAEVSEDQLASRESTAAPLTESLENNNEPKEAEAEVDERMSVDPTPETIPAPVHEESTKTPRQLSRNFRNLGAVAGSSPDLDDSPGARAVRQGIAEDEGSIDIEMNGSTIDSEHTIPVATQVIPLSQINSSGTTYGTKGSVRDQSEPALPATQPRRSSRTLVTASPAQPTRQSLAPDTDTQRRRLRSASRDLNENTPPVPPSSARSTRSVSRSKTSMSPSSSTNALNAPSTPRAGIMAGRSILPEIEEVEAEQATPKPKVRRSARATQASQLESSLPITQETSQPESSLPDSAPLGDPLEPQTQSTPVRQSRNRSASPLFMTQGSQIPATQYYEAQPETIPLEESESAEPIAVPSQVDTAPKKAVGRPKGSNTKAKKDAETQEESTTPLTPKAAAPKRAAVRAKSTKAQKQVETIEEAPLNPSQPTEPADSQSIPILNAQRSPSKSPTPPTSGQPHQSDRESSPGSSSDSDADADADDDDASIPDIPPPTLRHVPSSSQSQTTAPIYPSLSQLPKDLLRRSLNFFGAGGNNRQPQPQTPSSTRNSSGGKSLMNGNGHGHTGAGESDSDSGSGSDSSDDETKFVPSAIKNRFASGGMGKKKAASQPAGW